MSDTPKRRKATGATALGHPRRIQQRMRHAEWVQCRLRGMTYAAIAEQYGTAVTTVHAGVSAYMASFGRDDAEQMRAIENARLDLGLEKVLPLLDSADPNVQVKAHGELIRNSKRRSELNGMDRPAQAPVGPDGKTVQPIVQIVYETEPLPREDGEA